MHSSVLLGSTNLFDKTFALDDGEEARAQFYQEEQKTPAGVLDGRLRTAPDNSMAAFLPFVRSKLIKEGSFH